MGSLRVVEAQCPGERVEDLFGNAGEVAALEAGVIVGTDAGEQGDLLAAQPGDAALVAEGGQAGLFRGTFARRLVRNSRTSSLVLTTFTVRAGVFVLGGSAGTCYTEDSHL